MKVLKIIRKRWLRGEGEDCSRLRRADGRQCCLGFYLRSLGLKAKDILDLPAPYQASKRGLAVPAWLLDDNPCGYHSKDGQELMEINDEMDLKDSDREKNIAALFAKHDVKVVFK